MTADPKQPKDWRFFAGVTALTLSVVFPLSALFVPLMKLPTGEAAWISGSHLAGAPDGITPSQVPPKHRQAATPTHRGGQVRGQPLVFSIYD